MNVEKEVTISELKGKFVKEVDSTGKMNPYLQFTVGKQSARTENLQAGKEPAWNDPVVLTYFDESHIVVKAYDQDGNEREYMGGGKLQIKSLRFPGGMIEVNLTADSGEVLCTLTGKYTIKNLAPCPLLLIKNPKLDLVREDKHMLKFRPYLSFTADESTVCTQAKDQISGCLVSWSDCARLKVKEGSKLLIEMLDKDGNGSPVFSYQCSLKEFRCQHGSKRITVTDRSYNQLGQLHFDYQTVNLVSKEESVKNQDKEKKAQSELSAITIQKLTLSLKKENADVYAKVVVGCNCSKSETVKSSSEVQVPISGCLYAESRDNRLFLSVWEKNIVKDQLLASGCIYLDCLEKGSNQIALCKDGKEEAGTANLCVNVKATPCKTLTLSTISISVSEEGDIIGNNEPYLRASVGCCSGRTETANQAKATFKKPIELKFGAEESICLEIWDEDVASDSLLYSQHLVLSVLKSKGDHTLTVSKAGEEGQPEKKGKITFKYEYKTSGGQSPRKQTVKMAEVSKRDPPKEVQTERREQAQLESARNKKNSVTSQGDVSDNITINRSKDTLNLPSIVGGSIHQAYGDRIFDRQSAATLQKSILAFSMPKADRFNHGPKYTGQPSYCIDSCFKKTNTKGAGFGFGRKKQFPDWMERNMKQNPAPGSYFQGDHTLGRKGPTFGLSHKYYERVMIPRQKKSIGGHTIARKLSPIREPTPK